MRLGLQDREVAQYRADVLEAVGAFSLVALDSIVLERACESFPTALGSLDAIHLASALLIRDDLDALAFATHDDQLGIAARAIGFQVHGGSREVETEAKPDETTEEPGVVAAVLFDRLENRFSARFQ